MKSCGWFQRPSDRAGGVVGGTAVGPYVGTFPDLGDVKSAAHSAVAEGLKLPSGYAAALGCSCDRIAFTFTAKHCRKIPKTFWILQLFRTDHADCRHADSTLLQAGHE
jgi:hypothetical protein